MTGRERDPRTVCVGLTQTSRQIRAAAERRSRARRRQDAVVQERLAARQPPSAPSVDPSAVARGRRGAARGTA